MLITYQWLGMFWVWGTGSRCRQDPEIENNERQLRIKYTVFSQQLPRRATNPRSHRVPRPRTNSIPSTLLQSILMSYVHLQYYAYIYYMHVFTYYIVHTYVCMYVYRRVGYLACASRPFRFYRVFAYLVYGWLVCSSLVDLFFFFLSLSLFFPFRFFALLKHRVVQIINILNLWWAEPETRVFSESSNDNDSDNATIMYGTMCVFVCFIEFHVESLRLDALSS